MVRIRGVSRMRGWSTAVLVLALIASAQAVPSVAAASPVVQPVKATPVTPAAAVNWIACRDGFQCANVLVPLDYDQPSGPLRRPQPHPVDRSGAAGAGGTARSRCIDQRICSIEPNAPRQPT